MQLNCDSGSPEESAATATGLIRRKPASLLALLFDADEPVVTMNDEVATITFADSQSITTTIYDGVHNQEAVP